MTTTTKTCHFCGTHEDVRLNACHWTGTEYVRVDVCMSHECRGQVADRPRQPRRKRQPVILDAGGWAMIPSLNRAMSGRAS